MSATMIELMPTPNSSGIFYLPHVNKVGQDMLNEYQKLYDQMTNPAGVYNHDSTSDFDSLLGKTKSPGNSSENGCLVCSSNNVRLDRGSRICIDCGAETEDEGANLVEVAEWHYDNEKVNDRCGMVNNMMLYESGLSTNIAPCKFNSTHGRRLLNKLQLWQLMPSRERSLKDDFNYISATCGDRVSKCVIQYAQVLFKMAEDARKSEAEEGHRGDIRTGLLAAAVFYAAKIHGYSKTHKEIANWFEIDESYVSTGVKIFFHLMCNKIGMTNLITDHKSYVDKFCNNLGLSDEVRAMIQDIANKAVTLGILRDNTPSTIAATSVFFVINMYGLNISKALVSRRCNVSEVTITKTYQKLNSYLEHLL
jgi:transcription initiation factor TFIIB